jgi:hypothetical protein
LWWCKLAGQRAVVWGGEGHITHAQVNQFSLTCGHTRGILANAQREHDPQVTAASSVRTRQVPHLRHRHDSRVDERARRHCARVALIQERQRAHVTTQLYFRVLHNEQIARTCAGWVGEVSAAHGLQRTSTAPQLLPSSAMAKAGKKARKAIPKDVTKVVGVAPGVPVENTFARVSE